MATDRKGSRPGGRSSQVRRRVFGVIQRALEERDWNSLAIGEIAELADVNKTTIYRRWNNKEGLIADLLDSIADSHPNAPDLGTITQDLVAIAEYLAEMLDTQFGRSLIAAVAGSSDSILESAARKYWQQLFAKVGLIVRRAMERGELKPSATPADLVESVLAPIYLRVLVTRERIDRADIERIVERALGPYLAA